MNEIIKVDLDIQPIRFDVSILAGRIAPSTIELYRRDFEEYQAFAVAWAAAIAPETLARWRTVMAQASCSPNTINRKLSAVRSVMKAAAEQGYISHEAAQRFRVVEGVKVRALRERLKPDSRTMITAADMRRLCDAPNVATLAGKMHRALLLTLASSGLRISEAISLTPRQIERHQKDRKSGYLISVVGKTDTDARLVPLSPEAHEAIQAWISARKIETPWIFTGFTGRGSREPREGRIHSVSAWKIVKRYAKKCGLVSIKPHDFRRFVGTSLAKTDPRQAQKVLGHKDINTTYAHYVLDEMEIGLTDNLF